MRTSRVGGDPGKRSGWGTSYLWVGRGHPPCWLGPSSDAQILTEHSGPGGPGLQLPSLPVSPSLFPPSAAPPGADLEPGQSVDLAHRHLRAAGMWAGVPGLLGVGDECVLYGHFRSGPSTLPHAPGCALRTVHRAFGGLWALGHPLALHTSCSLHVPPRHAP